MFSTLPPLNRFSAQSRLRVSLGDPVPLTATPPGVQGSVIRADAVLTPPVPPGTVSLGERAVPFGGGQP